MRAWRPMRMRIPEQVNVDKVNAPALEQYKGKSMPVFKIFRDGRCLETVEGVEVPRLAALLAPPAKK